MLTLNFQIPVFLKALAHEVKNTSTRNKNEKFEEAEDGLFEEIR